MWRLIIVLALGLIIGSALLLLRFNKRPKLPPPNEK